MIRNITPTLALCAAMLTPLAAADPPTNRLTPVPHTMRIADGKFLFDEKPVQFLCGEMHYFRIPKELWRDRLHKARVMGLNCVSAYVFWSFHEREPGIFDFTGPADVAEFVKIAQEEGLFVFLRPGPYVCAEYDFGGYPYWLQNIKGMKWRANDPKFLDCMERYLQALAKELAHLQVTKGGPIALVQVENEYGSYGNDKVYLGKIRDMVRKVGFEVPLTTCDGGGQMPRGKVDGCLPTINGVLGQQVIDTINKHHPGGPYFVAEFYPAWFDNWGDPHSTKDRHTAARDYEWMLTHDISISMYMFHGGTNFWYTNGANSPPYRAQPTSYDYDAPLSESGVMTEKFMLFREVALKHLPPGESLPPVPPQPKTVTVPPFRLTESASLGTILPKPVRSAKPLSFEELKQDFGYVLYSTRLDRPVSGDLRCEDMRHYAWIMLDGKLVGRMDRRHGEDTVRIEADKPCRLDILVENVGRVNYGAALLDNHCGLVKPVTLNGRELTGWDHYPLPLYKLNPSTLKFGNSLTNVPAFHRGTFELKETGEVFLDTSKWGKGAVWVNGRSLGKFWRIGPQQTMYLPSCWTKAGSNEIIILELEDQGNRTTEGLAEPVLNRLQDGGKPRQRPGRDPLLEPGDLVHEGAFQSNADPQTAKFAQPVTARHLAFEIRSGHENDPHASVAEFEVLDATGKPLPRKGWRIWYASSEETVKEKAPAENMLDGKKNTFWHSDWDAAKGKHPFVVVVDMGEIKSGLTGIRYTGREDRPNGRVNQFRIYARPQFFLAKDATP